MENDNLFKKAAYTSLGLMLMGAKKAEEVIRGIGERAKLPESEIRLYVDKITAEADAARENFKYATKEEVRTYLDDLDVPSREDYEKLQQQILILQQEIDMLKMQKPNGPK